MRRIAESVVQLAVVLALAAAVAAQTAKPEPGAVPAQPVAQAEAPSATQTAAEAAAQTADQAWLALIDSAKYADSWKATAPSFQRRVSSSLWVQSMQSARAPFGKLVSRKLHSATYSKSLPGAPDGDYVVAVFDSSFENKQAATETVAVSLEKDGAWHVAGYFIK